MLLVTAGVVSSAWGLVQLFDYRASLERIHDKELPALMSAYEISRQGEGIATAASNLIIAQGKWARDAFVNRIEDEFDWINIQLEVISELGYDAEKINNIKNNEKSLQKSFDNLRLAIEGAAPNTEDASLKDNNSIVQIGEEVNYQLLLNGRRADSMIFSVADLTGSISGKINKMIADVQTSIDNSLWQVTLYSLGVTILALLVVLYLDTNVGRRVVGIQQAMSAIANGNKDKEIPDGGNDEISDMGAALRIFVKKLEEREELLKELFGKAKQESLNAKKAKSDFLAAMSHDLHTPLNAIVGFSDVMRSKTFGPLNNPYYERYIDDINNSGKLLSSLIDDILNLSSIDASKHETNEKPLNISFMIKNSIKMMDAMVKTQRLHIATNIEADLPMLRGDEKTLIHILNNLLSNAIKFTPEDGRVTVSAKLGRDSAINVLVADTGYGMSERDITEALRPFEQVDGARSRKHKGTGLGLYICLDLMELRGGTLGIESEKGKGTTVTLHFPPERTVYAS